MSWIVEANQGAGNQSQGQDHGETGQGRGKAELEGFCSSHERGNVNGDPELRGAAATSHRLGSRAVSPEASALAGPISPRKRISGVIDSPCTITEKATTPNATVTTVSR